MSTASTIDCSRPVEHNIARFFTPAGSVLAAAWSLAAALSVMQTSCIEIANAAGLLALLLFGIWFSGGVSALSSKPAGRLFLAAIFMLSALALSPLMQRAPTLHSIKESGLLAQFSAWGALGALALLWFASAILSSRKIAQDGNANGHAAFYEQFLMRATVRANLAAAGILIVIVTLAASGLPLKAAAPRAIMVAAVIFSSVAALRLAAEPSGAKSLSLSMALALAVCVAGGTWRYVELTQKVSSATALLAQDKPQDAQKIHDEAAALNEVLNSKSARIKLETEWALYREQKNDFNGALNHWWRIAAIKGVESSEMMPVRRLLCKMGDSLSAWRRLIYNGFPAINDPELAPGIKALGDLQNGDVRARLISALLAWERKEPKEECLRRLKEVQRVSPNEPSSRNLLKRLGEPVPDSSMWLPAELIVGKKISMTSLAGAIQELREVDTIVVLEKGQWELGLNARATPLHEEWPIVRIELNGEVIGRTQVTRSTDREYPFTFDVLRGDIYHVKIVFENQSEVIDQGHVSRRGLTINGLALRQTSQ